jgi:hypothetical protein
MPLLQGGSALHRRCCKPPRPRHRCYIPSQPWLQATGEFASNRRRHCYKRRRRRFPERMMLPLQTSIATATSDLRLCFLPSLPLLQAAPPSCKPLSLLRVADASDRNLHRHCSKPASVGEPSRFTAAGRATVGCHGRVRSAKADAGM